MLSVRLMPALAVMALCGVCLMYFGQWRAQRRLRSLLRVEMSRIFEQIDLLRLDTLQPLAEGVGTTRRAPAVVAETVPAPRAAPAPISFNRSVSQPTGEAYAAALELAARGADQGELTMRCGLGRDEARILVAMQGAAARRANAA
jgi:hypothetical protein